ncbi:MAG: hypothetical protein LW834_12065 [Cyanobium sp. 49614_E6]|nr:hypothetical protein [Cyanobium sp. 49614_E6]MCE2837677.1 hypothetical protein [Cyanobium sp. 49614_E6]
MSDLKITELQPLPADQLQATDPIAVADLSASETAKITTKDFIQRGLALIDSNSIPLDKLVGGGVTVPPNSITTLELAGQAVAAENLQNNSSTTVTVGLPASGAFIGQWTLDRTNNKVYVWDGSSWLTPAAAGSLNSVSGVAGPVFTTTVTTTGDTATIATVPNVTTSGGQVLAGPAITGGPAAYRPLASTDLPTASTGAKGAVRVSGGGLSITGDLLSINNTVSAATGAQIVTYNDKGLVTGGRALTGADLPAATASDIGAVRPGSGLSVDVFGTLNHSNTVAATTATKVTFDTSGHITGFSSLTDADIPNHSASKLVTGTLDPLVYGTRTIPQLALADYSVAYIQEVAPAATSSAAHIGMLWFQESTGSLRMWNGNSWFSIGLGRLSQDNLRWGGLFDATTGRVTGITDFGTQAGLTVGGTIPAAADSLGGLYLVCEVAGSSISVTPSVSYDPGDWLLCINQTSGWKRIDTLSSGGGGSTVSNLDDLLDVKLTAPTIGDFLQLNSSGQWVNVSVLDEGTWT